MGAAVRDWFLAKFAQIVPISAPACSIVLVGVVLERLEGPVDALRDRLGGDGVASATAEVPLLESITVKILPPGPHFVPGAVAIDCFLFLGPILPMVAVNSRQSNSKRIRNILLVICEQEVP